MRTIPTFKHSDPSHQQRFEAHLPLSVTVYDDESGTEACQQTVTLVGYTCKVSTDALSLIGPFYQFGYRYLMGRDRTLQIELRLPDGDISFQGFPTRYTKMSTDEPGDGYMMTGPALDTFVESDVNCLIEVSIVVMSDENQHQFKEYLRGLAQEAEAIPSSPPPVIEPARRQTLAA